MEKLLTEKDLYFVIDDLWRTSYLDGYNAVIKCGLYEYIRDNEIKSFMFSPPVDMTEQFEKLYSIADRRMIHSGASYGCTMRMVEQMVKMGYLKWKIWYIEHNRPDMIHKLNVIIKNVRRSLSDPKCKMCRNRLEHEYFDLLIPENM